MLMNSRSPLFLLTALALLLAPTIAVAAPSLYFSHNASRSRKLGGVTMDKGDVVRLDMETGVAEKVFDDRDFFDKRENIDAVDLLSNGHLVVSTTSSASTDRRSNRFTSGDLIEIDISGPTPLLVGKFLESGQLYTTTEDINGFSTGPAGSFLSTVDSSPAVANSISFDDGDTASFYTGGPSSTASLYFDEDTVFKNNANVDAISFLSPDSIAISTRATEWMAGRKVRRGDVVKLTRTDSGWSFSEILFSGRSSNLGFGRDVNLDAVYISMPEPSGGLLLLLGVFTLVGTGRRTAAR